MGFRTFLFACIAVGVLAGTVGAAEAKTCLVKKLRYTNQGGYQAGALTVNAPGGYADNRGGIIMDDESRTLDLRNSKDLAPGTEVWLSFKIEKYYGDDKQKCRKNGTKLVYDPDKGNTWSYYSGGTTENRNRCRFDDGNKCIAP